MPRIVYITHFKPSEIGDGGNHRSYQTLFDLQSNFGVDSVKVIFISLYPIYTSKWTKRLIWKCISGLVRIAQLFLGLFFYITSLGDFSATLTRIRPLNKLGYRYKFFREIQQYCEMINRGESPEICVIDHPYFECFIDINQRNHIPTFISAHNIEAFDGFIYDHWTYKIAMNSSILFADEYNCLNRCDERLVISKVEKTILDSLGAKSKYYAYIPVGKIRERLEKTLLQRQIQSPEPGLLVLLGSYYHLTTAEGMDWLISNLLEHGTDLTNKVHLIVAGNGTHLLTEKFRLPNWIEVKGWMEQDDLDDLMIRAQAVLIPQRLGFGALTRLSELACAGIPVIVSKHPTHALEIPPGVLSVEDNWQAWISEIATILTNGSKMPASKSTYDEWAFRQENGLVKIVNKFMSDQKS